MIFPPLHFFSNDIKHRDYIAKTAMDNVISSFRVLRFKKDKLTFARLHFRM